MAANGNKQVAADFEKIIKEARDRKKNEALAAKIFNKDRHSSGPGGAANSNKLSGAGSLASRAGVKKQQSSSTPSSSRSRQSAGNINGEWTHDLHSSSNLPSATIQKQPPKGPKGSLAARITDPSAPVQIPTGPRQKQQRRAAQVAQALIRTEIQQHQRQQHHNRAPINAPTGPAAGAAAAAATFSKGFTIRGLAGPYVVMAQNFAAGTTSADIESAMTPVGGIVTQCRIVKNSPIVIAEIVFESKEGADNVIRTFDGQTADGRVLSVYHKPGNTPTSSATPSRSVSEAAQQVVDGSYGFDEPMTMDTDMGSGGGGGGGYQQQQNSSFAGGNGKAPPTEPSSDRKGGAGGGGGGGGGGSGGRRQRACTVTGWYGA